MGCTLWFTLTLHQICLMELTGCFTYAVITVSAMILTDLCFFQARTPLRATQNLSTSLEHTQRLPTMAQIRKDAKNSKQLGITCSKCIVDLTVCTCCIWHCSCSGSIGLSVYILMSLGKVPRAWHGLLATAGSCRVQHTQLMDTCPILHLSVQ